MTPHELDMFKSLEKRLAVVEDKVEVMPEEIAADLRGEITPSTPWREFIDRIERAPDLDSMRELTRQYNRTRAH